MDTSHKGAIMKHATSLAALVALLWLPATASAQDKPADKPAAKPAAADAAPAPRRARDDRDARECLQLATNREIMVCAEKYR